MDEVRMWWGVRTRAEGPKNKPLFPWILNDESLVFDFDFRPLKWNRMTNLGIILLKDLTGSFSISVGMEQEMLGRARRDGSPGFGAGPGHTTKARESIGRMIPAWPAIIRTRSSLDRRRSPTPAVRPQHHQQHPNRDLPALHVGGIHPDPRDWRRAMDAYQVVATNQYYPSFFQAHRCRPDDPAADAAARGVAGQLCTDHQ